MGLNIWSGVVPGDEWVEVRRHGDEPAFYLYLDGTFSNRSLWPVLVECVHKQRSGPVEVWRTWHYSLHGTH